MRLCNVSVVHCVTVC